MRNTLICGEVDAGGASATLVGPQIVREVVGKVGKDVGHLLTVFLVEENGLTIPAIDF